MSNSTQKTQQGKDTASDSGSWDKNKQQGQQGTFSGDSEHRQGSQSSGQKTGSDRK